MGPARVGEYIVHITDEWVRFYTSLVKIAIRLFCRRSIIIVDNHV